MKELTNQNVESASGSAAYRQLCPNHPDVNYKTAWGCPECVREMRDGLERLRLAVSLHIRAVDRIMIAPPSFQRDMAVANEISKLGHSLHEMNPPNDKISHGGENQ